MALYFVQHGVALSKQQNPDRPLSNEGGLDVLFVAKRLEQLSVKPSAIYHSGKTRAQQTAEIFADCLGAPDVIERTGMDPNDEVQSFAQALKNDGTMFVGHLPQLGKLVSYLVAGDENSDIVKFTNAAVVCIEQDESGFYIDWLLKQSMC